jgi:formylglycine-generating enzyme required for sulfatase activity
VRVSILRRLRGRDQGKDRNLTAAHSIRTPRAATRGRDERLYSWGDVFDPLRANVAATWVWRTTPVGVFPGGDTPEGISDMTGNVNGWTSSLYGRDNEAPEFSYPYRASDGREDLSACSAVRRVLRGGAWDSAVVSARSASRFAPPQAIATCVAAFAWRCRDRSRSISGGP